MKTIPEVVSDMRAKWEALPAGERAVIGWFVSGAIMLCIAVIIYFILGGVLAPSMLEMTNETMPLTDTDAIALREDAVGGLSSNLSTISLVFFMAGMLLIIVGLIQAFRPMIGGRGGF